MSHWPMPVLDSIPTSQLFDRLAKLLREGWRDGLDVDRKSMAVVIRPIVRRRTRRLVGGTCIDCGCVVPRELRSSRCSTCRMRYRREIGEVGAIRGPHRFTKMMTCVDCGTEIYKVGVRARCKPCAAEHTKRRVAALNRRRPRKSSASNNRERGQEAA